VPRPEGCCFAVELQAVRESQGPVHA
jgi:hypothetical protein